MFRPARDRDVPYPVDVGYSPRTRCWKIVVSVIRNRSDTTPRPVRSPRDRVTLLPLHGIRYGCAR